MRMKEIVKNKYKMKQLKNNKKWICKENIYNYNKSQKMNKNQIKKKEKIKLEKL